MRALWLVLAAVCGILLPVQAFAQKGAAEAAPSDPGLTERVETRILQIDVSVVDGKSSKRRSVPGLRKEMFELRLDGKKLGDEQYARVAFDEVCLVGEATEPPGQAASSLAPTGAELPPALRRRSIIVMLDFNFLDGQMRHDAAEALRRLADRGLPESYQVKVVGYSSSVFEILPFTGDAEELRRAAQFVETGLLVGGPGVRRVLDADFTPGDNCKIFAKLGEGALAEIPSPPGKCQRYIPGHFQPSSEIHMVLLHWDPRRSLAALEAVIRGHSGLPGRKALVLFTGERFLTADYNLETYGGDVLEAAQEGLSIWIVDARGYFAEGAHRAYRSDLVTMLANDTGGETLRSSPDLSMIFPRVEESLDCYYLFSIPVAAGKKGRNLSISVRLQSSESQELRRYRVRHRTRVRLHDRDTEQRLRRTAALLNPDSYPGEIPLQADMRFPGGVEGGELPIELSVPLASLDYRPVDGAYEASFFVDLAVDRDGLDTVCMIPEGDQAALLHRIRLGEPPDPGSRAHLVVRESCHYQGGGLYTLRAVLTDPSRLEPSAASATYWIRSEPGTELSIAALRAGYNTGRDYLLADSREGEASVPHDRERSAFVPLARDEAVSPSDTLIFRYVLCADSAAQAGAEFRRLVYRQDEGKARIAFLLAFPEEGEQVFAGPSQGKAFCAEFEDRIPPASLSEGEFGFALLRGVPGEEPGRAALEEILAAGEGPSLLGSLRFSVREP